MIVIMNVRKPCSRCCRKAVLEERMKAQAALRKEYQLKNQTPKTNQRSWNFMHRVLPSWFFPAGRISFFVVSASFLAGLYAYYRYTNTYDVYSQQNISTKWCRIQWVELHYDCLCLLFYMFPFTLLIFLTSDVMCSTN